MVTSVNLNIICADYITDVILEICDVTIKGHLGN